MTRFSAIAAGIIALSTSGVLRAAPARAMDQVITSQGVVVREHEDIMAFFAGLNALGYVSESQRGEAPVRAPEFHPLRSDLRARLAKSPGDKKALERLFAKYPKPLDWYLLDLVKPKGSAARKTILAFASSAALGAFFDETAEARRKLHLSLAQAVDQDLNKLTRWYQSPGEAAQVVVVVNPLDDQLAAHEIQSPQGRVLTVGAHPSVARVETVATALRAGLAGAVKGALSARGPAQRHWGRLDPKSAIRRRFQSVDQFVAHNLAWALATQAIGRTDRNNAAALRQAAEQRGLRWASEFEVSVSPRGPRALPAQVRAALSTAKL